MSKIVAVYSGAIMRIGLVGGLCDERGFQSDGVLV